MARFSVRAILGLVAVVALGLAAMRNGSRLAAGLTLAVTMLTLATASVGAMVRPGPVAAWRGFAVFGWTYFLLFHLGWLFTVLFHIARYEPRHAYGLPTQSLMTLLAEGIHPKPVRPEEPDFLARHPRIKQSGDAHYQLVSTFGRGGLSFQDADEQRLYDDTVRRMAAHQQERKDRSLRIQASIAIGHSCLVLTFSLLGSVVGVLLAGRGGNHHRDHSGSSDRHHSHPSSIAPRTGTAP